MVGHAPRLFGKFVGTHLIGLGIDDFSAECGIEILSLDRQLDADLVLRDIDANRTNAGLMGLRAECGHPSD